MGFIKRHFTVFLIAAILIFAGLSMLRFIEEPHGEHNKWIALAQSFGHALVIAGVLAILVDVSFKESLVRDVAKHVFTWEMPQDAKDCIHDLLRPTVVKRNNVVDYVLSIDGDDVLFEVTDSFDLYNYTSKVQKHRFRLEIDIHERPIKESIALWAKPDNSDAINLPNDKINADIIDKDGITYYELPGNRSIKLQPVNNGGGPSCRVMWKYKLRLPKWYSYIQSASIMTIGSEIRVTYPADILELGFEDCKDHADGSLVWRYDRVYLIGQYIRMWWRPKSEDGNDG